MALFSFASGSSTLPPLVRAALTRDVDDWHGSGFSALELPFTGQAFGEILATAEDDLRRSSIFRRPIGFSFFRAAPQLSSRCCR